MNNNRSHVLTREQINEILKKDFHTYLFNITLDDLVGKVIHIPTKRDEQDVIRNYSAGHRLRSFVEEQNIVGVGYIGKSFIPILTTPIYLREDLSNIFGYLNGSFRGGINQLEAVKIITIRPKRRSTIFRINNYETIRDSIVNEASKHSELSIRDLEQKFDKELGIFKRIIDEEIAGPFNSAYEEYMQEIKSGPYIPFSKFLLSKKQE
jgi:hypothetical protein